MQSNASLTDFYKEHYYKFIKAKDKLCDLLSTECSENIEHLKIRIKSEESTKIKLEKLGFDKTLESALTNLTDIVGVRIICRFLSDVYLSAAIIESHLQLSHVISKDYIKHPKENGYRSYHIIVKTEIDGDLIPIEIQIRTISQDSWASLEHKMKYKKQITNSGMIKSELKRLADEMASSDVCMQTLRELINLPET